MEDQLKRRLVGAVVLVSLAVIFLPMLLDPQPDGEIRIETSNIPPKPVVTPESEFTSPVDLPDDEPLIPPLTESERGSEAASSITLAPPPAAEPKPTPALAAAGEPAMEAQTRVGLSAWVVQVVSLSKHDNAVDLAQKLKDEGYAAFIEQIYLNGRNLYRVRVGPELDRKRAERAAEEILAAFKLKGQVIRYP